MTMPLTHKGQPITPAYYLYYRPMRGDDVLVGIFDSIVDIKHDQVRQYRDGRTYYCVREVRGTVTNAWIRTDSGDWQPVDLGE